MKKTQVENDQAYRAKQRLSGIVRKTVRVPADKWPRLQKFAEKLRKEAEREAQKSRSGK